MSQIIEVSEDGEVKSVKTKIDLGFITAFNSEPSMIGEDDDVKNIEAIKQKAIEDERLTIVELTVPQTDFLYLDVKYGLFVAGFGAGKSTCMIAAVMRDLKVSSEVKLACYCPTFDLLSLITAPYLELRLTQANINYTYNKSSNIFSLESGQSIILRSMDNPARIVGYQVFRSHIDELDTLNADKAEEAWNKIIARNRQRVPILKDGKKILLEEDIYDEDDEGRKILVAKKNTPMVHENRVSAYSTPEGFRFCHKRWVKLGGKNYGYVQAPTYSNPHNPPDYISNLRETYPAGLVDAYIEGKFVNLKSGSVYPEFCRELNNTNEEIEFGEHLHIGMDFNVNKMAASICVRRKDEDGNDILLQLDEITQGRDTETVCEIIQERHPAHSITIYPDSSGKNTSSKGASVSDLSIIKTFGFKVKAKTKNPFIKDRVASVNGLVRNSNGLRRFFINVNKCPDSTDCLEQQIYKNGVPSKDDDNDHSNDAIGYLIFWFFPIQKKSAVVGSHSSHLQVR